jgi:ATP-dependent phosphoenolpyruvate carboxykinase
MKLEYTRKIINAIHDGSLLNAQFEETPIFNLAVPTQVKGVPTEVLHPENSVGDMRLKPWLVKDQRSSVLWIMSLVSQKYYTWEAWSNKQVFQPVGL